MVLGDYLLTHPSIVCVCVCVSGPLRRRITMSSMPSESMTSRRASITFDLPVCGMSLKSMMTPFALYAPSSSLILSFSHSLSQFPLQLFPHRCWSYARDVTLIFILKCTTHCQRRRLVLSQPK